MLIDSHAHLDFPRFNEDREEVIKRAKKEGVEYIVNVGADIKSSRRGLELSLYNENIFSTVGIHPHEADTVDEKAIKILTDLAKTDKVVAIGEIGLDYYYDNSPRELQKRAFRLQMRLAQKLSLPIVIHTREADDDTLKLMKEENAEKNGGIVHCFASNLDMARASIEMGFYLGFGGLITFNNASKLRKVLKELPLERIVLETDAPYLTPVPYRGKRNEPAYIKYVAKKIAEIKKISLKELAKISNKNTIDLYNLDINI